MSKAERARRRIRSQARQQKAALDQNRVASPKGDRPRYANGRLKPPTPNEVVVAFRRRMLGNPEAKGQNLRHAENALDLMLERGWLPKGLHTNANDYRRLYLAAFPALPGLKSGHIEEAPTAERHIDRVSASLRTPNPDGNPAAMSTLRAIWRVLDLRPASGAELVDVCLIPGAWPAWLIGMIEKRTLSPPEQQARAAFFQGLHIVGQVLARPPSALAA